MASMWGTLLILIMYLYMCIAGWCTRSPTSEDHTSSWRGKTTTTSQTGALRAALWAPCAESVSAELSSPSTKSLPKPPSADVFTLNTTQVTHIPTDKLFLVINAWKRQMLLLCGSFLIGTSYKRCLYWWRSVCLCALCWSVLFMGYLTSMGLYNCKNTCILKSP